jgi:hypothetical protein
MSLALATAEPETSAITAATAAWRKAALAVADRRRRPDVRSLAKPAAVLGLQGERRIATALREDASAIREVRFAKANEAQAQRLREASLVKFWADLRHRIESRHPRVFDAT